MSTTIPCPAPDQLAAFWDGQLNDHETELLVLHLEACPNCRSWHDSTLHPELDSLLCQYLSSLEPTAFQDEPECQATVQQLLTLHESRLKLPSQLGPYTLIEQIGKGGMGTVYRALHRHLNRDVAIKVLNSERTTDPLAFARFDRERKALGQLTHPNLVAALDANEVAGTHYLAMELIEGADVAFLLRQHGPFPVADACEIARQTALGLEHIHQAGYIHRDLKPSNLLLTNEGTVKIADLGLAGLKKEAHSTDELTSEGTILGSVDYMAPEQLRDPKTTEKAADIYSLGCILYHMLTGSAPHAKPGRTPTERLFAHLSDEIPNLRTQRDVPKPLASLLTRMLLRNPTERITSAVAVATMLEPFARNANLAKLFTTDGSVLFEPRPTERVPSQRRWRWAVGSLLAVVLLWLLGGVIVRLETERGTLVIEINDPALETRIKDGKLIVVGLDNKETYTIQPSERNRRLPTGSYKVHIVGTSGLEVESDTFELKRGKETVIRVIATNNQEAAPVKPVTLPLEVPSNPQSDREMTRHLLSLGGQVRINDSEEHIKDVKKLPQTDFRLTGVDLSNCEQLTDNDLVFGEKYPKLKFLCLNSPRFTADGLAHFRNCRELTHLALLNLNLTTKALAHFRECRKLQTLRLAKSQFNNTDLTVFSECSDLRELDCFDTPLDNRGVAHFQTCRQLTYFLGAQTKIDDLALAHLEKCHFLYLILGQTAITDRGLQHIVIHDQLRTLHLEETNVTDEGLAHFRKTKSITGLKLDGTRVTDMGLVHFKNNSNLNLLSLQRTEITDNGIVPFFHCRELMELNLQGTRMTPAAIARLPERFPKATIAWGDDKIILPAKK